MSKKGKGIVKDTPSATGGKIMVITAEENSVHVKKYTELDFLPKEGITVVKGDAVEFEFVDNHWAGILSKLSSPSGKVTIAPPDNRGGELILTNPDPNEFGKRVNDKIRFIYIGADFYPINENDTIQVIIESDSMSTVVKVVG